MNGFYFHIAAPLIVTALLCGAVGARADTDKAMTLQESIAIALSRNASVHASEEGVKAAEARRKAAFTGFLPRLSTAYSYT